MTKKEQVIELLNDIPGVCFKSDGSFDRTLFLILQIDKSEDYNITIESYNNENYDLTLWKNDYGGRYHSIIKDSESKQISEIPGIISAWLKEIE